ncbi:MAG: aminotransferase class V-fold PLP-dependent enzyme [Lachnospiraceae bacterium]|nr:aminotransferase class V-fold PLP-dependent enzyme [Lachnospiraceae bacterium]
MNTPICDFVRTYANSKQLRFHMPGHKGAGTLGIEHLDITEIEGADVLYRAEGIIKESELNASALFGSALTKYSTEGSSLSIRAMLYLAMLYAKSIGREPRILAGRNAHHTFMTAAALLDLKVDWLYPEHWDNLVACEITPDYLDHVLCSQTKPAAVYITSPDYLGNVADIAELSAVCHKHGILLLVDNAHGAYLNFLSENRHPITLGADICCDSAHKTLPVLTGGGYLHISKHAPECFCQQAEKALSLFASTSPSYLIMQSLDAANRYLAEGYAEKLADYVPFVGELKVRLADFGYTLHGNEPLKITIAPKNLGYTGYELAEILAEHRIICEFADPDFVVFMLTPEISKEDLDHLVQTLCAVPRKEAIDIKPPMPSKPKQICSIREALFATSTEVSIQDSLGQTLASTRISCPPAIPIVVCGENIDEDAIRCFEYYGVEMCQVMKE